MLEVLFSNAFAGTPAEILIHLIPRSLAITGDLLISYICIKSYSRYNGGRRGARWLLWTGVYIGVNAVKTITLGIIPFLFLAGSPAPAHVVLIVHGGSFLLAIYGVMLFSRNTTKDDYGGKPRSKE